MILDLTPWQRSSLLVAVGQVRGAAVQYWKACKLLDILEFSREEEAEIGLIREVDGLRWPAEMAEHRFRIEIPDKNLCSDLKRFVAQAPLWKGEDRTQVDDLFQQLGLLQE